MKVRNPQYLAAAVGMLFLLFSASSVTPAQSSESSQTIYLPLIALSGWEEIGPGSASGGGISNTGGDSTSASIAIGPDNRPIVAWTENHDGSRDIYVRRWDGSDWAEVGTGSASGGGISSNPWDSTDPSIAIAPDGTPYITWSHFNGGNNEIYVKRWNGSVWEEVGWNSASAGGISNNLWASVSPSIAIAPDGMPYVAWVNDYISDSYVYVRRWDGVSWVEVGAGSASEQGIGTASYDSGPSIAIGPDGTPYIAWEGYTGDEYGVFVLGWSISGWQAVGWNSTSPGGIANNDNGNENPDIAVGPDGAPIVAWEKTEFWFPTLFSSIYVRRWTGSDWDEVGAGSATGNGIGNSGLDFSPTIALSPGGELYVAWEKAEIYVLRWTGSSWEEVGWSSASGGGISNTTGNSSMPSIAIAPDGTPYIAWEDATSGLWEIYVRRFIE